MPRRKIILLVSLLALSISSFFLFPSSTGVVSLYDHWFFYPFQSLRGVLLFFLSVSIGDILYIAGGAALLVTICRWVYYLVRFRRKKGLLARSVINTINAALGVYLLFVWGWGANYYKRPLGEQWALYTKMEGTAAERRAKDSVMLVNFNNYLVKRLNEYAPHYHPLGFDEVNKRAKAYYSTYTNSSVKKYGLGLKPTLFNYFLERVGVEGYYNPFTGEGQVSTTLPGFILPFVMSHEMAHQAGIAAEGDANLVAYALGIKTTDSAFRYSAYLDIWLYANRKLYRRDSGLAVAFAHRLNALTTAHLDTLEELSKKYDNDVARASSDLYDDYLKMQQQKEGLHSYGNVVSVAWQLECGNAKNVSDLINVY